MKGNLPLLVAGGVIAAVYLVFTFLLGTTAAAVVFLIGVISVGGVSVYAGASYSPENWKRRRAELEWIRDGEPGPVGELADDVDFSVVVPCFNEEDRIGTMLRDTCSFLVQGKMGTWEIIVVDDGSRDTSVEVVLAVAKNLDVTKQVRVIRVRPNRGKGYAVKQGVFAASGKLILMADADAATLFSDVLKLKAQLSESTPVVIGSRAALEEESIAQRSARRTFLMHLFHFCVAFTFAFCGCPTQISDTQCGFKLFTRKAAHLMFSNMHLERWAFDVELLIVAAELGYQVKEQPVNWREIDGSKMNLRGMIRMGTELLTTCFSKRLGVWRINRRP